jgi:hypothetical protein
MYPKLFNFGKFILVREKLQYRPSFSMISRFGAFRYRIILHSRSLDSDILCNFLQFKIIEWSENGLFSISVDAIVIVYIIMWSGKISY